MRTKIEFPLKPLERIAKKAGVKRISKTALKALRREMLDYSDDLAKDVVAISKHAERNTVLKKDVLLVKKLHST
jgi:histone H3/H4